jgi:dihydrofolate reductase
MQLKINKTQEIILIAAMAENKVIGKDNAMPWTVRGNLAHFKKMTMGWPCIMGRKTWESLPKKPLPGRLNIIISKTFNIQDIESSLIPSAISASLREENFKIFSSLTAAIEYCADYDKIFICGGESIYSQAMPLADKIDLTLIPGHYDGDTFFPEIDAGHWIKTSVVDYNDFSVITYTKKSNLEKEQI